MKKLILMVCLCLSVLVSNSNGVIFISLHNELVFSKSSVQEGTTWSPDFELAENALVSKPAHEGYNLWIQTGKIPAGYNWGPPRSISLTVSLNGTLSSSTIMKDYMMGQNFRVYARYGCDGVHWSSWTFIPQNEDPSTSKYNNSQYKTILAIPPFVYQSYDSTLEQWLKTTPNQNSDEDDFCRWLLKKNPRYFEKEQLLIGYIQLYIDCNHSAGEDMRFTALSIGWGMSESGFSRRFLRGGEKGKQKWSLDISKVGWDK